MRQFRHLLLMTERLPDSGRLGHDIERRVVIADRRKGLIHVGRRFRSRVIVNHMRRSWTIVPARIACFLTVSNANRGQKIKALSRGSPGRRSTGA
jgi:hypothetical protein